MCSYLHRYIIPRPSETDIAKYSCKDGWKWFNRTVYVMLDYWWQCLNVKVYLLIQWTGSDIVAINCFGLLCSSVSATRAIPPGWSITANVSIKTTHNSINHQRLT